MAQLAGGVPTTPQTYRSGGIGIHTWPRTMCLPGMRVQTRAVLARSIASGLSERGPILHLFLRA